MKISITGQSIKIGQSLQEYVKERIEQNINKYFDHLVKIEAVFTKDANYFSCHIVIHTGIHLVLRGNSSSFDIYASFDNALIKIESQLRRYKDKLHNHKKHKLSELEFDKSVEGTKYVISPFSAPDYEEDSQEPAEDNPIIIAEKSTQIETLTVGEAVMKMDLAHLPA